MSLANDLMTIIDFCREMVPQLEPQWAARFAIREAHDIAHVLEGGARTMKPWRAVTQILDGGSDFRIASDVWPDVSRRMASVLARAEAMS